MNQLINLVAFCIFIIKKIEVVGCVHNVGFDDGPIVVLYPDLEPRRSVKRELLQVNVKLTSFC